MDERSQRSFGCFGICLMFLFSHFPFPFHPSIHDVSHDHRKARTTQTGFSESVVLFFFFSIFPFSRSLHLQHPFCFLNPSIRSTIRSSIIFICPSRLSCGRSSSVPFFSEVQKFTNLTSVVGSLIVVNLWPEFRVQIA